MSLFCIDCKKPHDHDMGVDIGECLYCGGFLLGSLDEKPQEGLANELFKFLMNSKARMVKK